MGIFEDVMFNAKSAATTVGKKAGRLVDISKLRLNATELNNEISKRYEALGRVVYDAVKQEQDVSGLVDECIVSIDALYQRLDEVNEKINALQNKLACQICGTQNAESALFCSHCGAKLKNDSEQSDSDKDVRTEGFEDEEPAKEEKEESAE